MIPLDRWTTLPCSLQDNVATIRLTPAFSGHGSSLLTSSLCPRSSIVSRAIRLRRARDARACFLKRRHQSGSSRFP